MFLPIGDIPNPKGTPYTNYVLIGINVAVFLLISVPLMSSHPDMSNPLLDEYIKIFGTNENVNVLSIIRQISSYDLFILHYGFRPSDPSLMNLFISMFLHAGWMHIAGNMLFLWIFGDNVEYRLGHINYLFAYLGSGMVATLFFALFVGNSQVPLIGASGAISGVLGCYFIWFPKNKIKTFVFLFPIIMTTLMIPARLVLGFYLVLDNLLPFILSMGNTTGVAHGAHIGGFLAGIGLSVAMDNLPALFRQKKTFKKQQSSASKQEGKENSELINTLIDSGDLDQAVMLYESLHSRGQRLKVNDNKILRLGMYLLETGEYDRSLIIFRRFIADRPTSSEIDLAFLGAGKAMINKRGGVVSAYQYFLQALDVTKSIEVKEEARRHLRDIERSGH